MRIVILLLPLIAGFVIFWYGSTPKEGRSLSTPGPDETTRLSSAPSYEAVEAELFDTLQAVEYRIPYQPPARWPVFTGECPHENLAEITSHGSYEIHYICADCGYGAPGMNKTY